MAVNYVASMLFETVVNLKVGFYLLELYNVVEAFHALSASCSIHCQIFGCPE
jgi:hypothetical protein